MSGLLRVPFFRDELLTSYLSRSARANGASGLRQFCYHLGLSYNSIVSGDIEAIGKAADLLGDERKELVERRISTRGLRHVEFRGDLFTNTQMRRVPAHVCWQCLLDDETRVNRIPRTRRYARIFWALECLPVCVTHSVIMSPIPSPGRKLSFDFCQLIDGVSVKVGDQENALATPFERYLEDRLGLKQGPPCALDETGLPVCIVACENVGKAVMFGRVYQERRLGQAAMRLVYSRGFEVLSSGGESVDAMLDNLCRDVDSSHATSGSAIYGTLYRALSRRADNSAFLGWLVLKHAIQRYPHLSLQQVFPELVQNTR